MSQYSKDNNIRCMCINCYTTVDADIAFAGSKQKCPKCNNKIYIPKASILPGTLVGDYLVDKMIGIGGMGEVYEARSVVDEKDYALKLIRPSIINEEEIESFKNEIRMNLRVSHNNFIKAFESGTDKEGRLYLAMEFVKGKTLEDHIIQFGRFDEDHALNIILTCCRALKTAWDNWQIIHRDLKPSNILLTQSNVVKIMDLGVSVNKAENSGETHIIGTPYYMSPEQIETPNNIDQRSDIYSLGATLYELITGAEPFKGKNSDEIFDNVLKDTPYPPAYVRPDVSKATCDLIKHFMEKDRANRPQTWEEAIESVEQTLKRYEKENSTYDPYDNPALVYTAAADLHGYIPTILAGVTGLTGFIFFAYWLVKSQLP